MTRQQTLERQITIQPPKEVSDAVYQLKITLGGSTPPIWLRFTVKNKVMLEKLHQIIQVVMGWEDCHLYKFERGKRQHYLQVARPR